jgi:hypothetical protein
MTPSTNALAYGTTYTEAMVIASGIHIATNIYVPYVQGATPGVGHHERTYTCIADVDRQSYVVNV